MHAGDYFLITAEIAALIRHFRLIIAFPFSIIGGFEYVVEYRPVLTILWIGPAP